jgi:parallel beta-helix repeat protein
VTNNNQGLHLSYSSGNNVIGNIVKANRKGIVVGNSPNNNFSRNMITDNEDGVRIGPFSYKNRLYGNLIIHNNRIGIYTSSVNDPTYIYENNITENEYGIVLDECKRNSVLGNNITYNMRGIYLASASSDNKFYHNSFIDNSVQVEFSTPSQSSFNLWDDGIEGNYWSDYNVTDANHDGIGDAPYTIDSKNQDKYPLVNPTSRLNIPQDELPEDTPLWGQWWLWLSIAAVIVSAFVAFYFLKIRKHNVAIRKQPNGSKNPPSSPN